MDIDKLWESLTDALDIGDIEQAVDAAAELRQALDGGNYAPANYSDRLHMMVESAAEVFRRAQLEHNDMKLGAVRPGGMA